MRNVTITILLWKSFDCLYFDLAFRLYFYELNAVTKIVLSCIDFLKKSEIAKSL